MHDTNGAHDVRPIIWKDDINTLNIGSVSGSMIFEKIDLRTNGIFM